MSLIQHFGFNALGTDYAVGDIHGCFGKLRDCLAQFFNPAVDRLFAVGDLVDRGPECAEVDEWLALPWFHSVKGNHDDMAQRWPNGHMEADHYAASGGAWNIGRTATERQLTADAIAALPLAIDVVTERGLVGLVHAECPYPSWAQFRAALQGFDGLNRTRRDAIEGLAMWGRERIHQRIATPIEGVRAMICGHTPVPEPLQLGNVYYIDTGACYGHAFAFINLATLESFRVKRRAA